MKRFVSNKGNDERCAASFAFSAASVSGSRASFKARSLILIERGRNQLRQSDRGQQACGDSPGERGAGRRDHRQPDPQCIRGCRMGVVGQGVEKQIGQSSARQMVSGGRARSKDQPLGVHAPCGRFTPEVLRRERVVFEQPQHAAFDAGQQRASRSRMSPAKSCRCC